MHPKVPPRLNVQSRAEAFCSSARFPDGAHALDATASETRPRVSPHQLRRMQRRCNREHTPSGGQCGQAQQRHTRHIRHDKSAVIAVADRCAGVLDDGPRTVLAVAVLD